MNDEYHCPYCGEKSCEKIWHTPLYRLKPKAIVIIYAIAIILGILICTITLISKK